MNIYLQDAAEMAKEYTKNGLESIKKICGDGEVAVQTVRFAARMLVHDAVFGDWAFNYIMKYGTI